MADFDVVVIGAGCGGLTAGALLAARGGSVLVLDMNDMVGGCASGFVREGHVFDVGASVVELLVPLRRAFAALGTTLEDEVDMILCDPTFTVILRDGERIHYPASTEGIIEALRAVSAEDARNWERFASYCSDLYDVCRTSGHAHVLGLASGTPSARPLCRLARSRFVVEPTRWNDEGADHVGGLRPVCLTISDAMVDAGPCVGGSAMMERHGANHRAEIELQRPGWFAVVADGRSHEVAGGRSGPRVCPDG